jgi:hypothetical protein
VRKTLLLALIVSVLSGLGRHPAYAESRDEPAIRSLIDRWTKAAHEKNVDGVMSSINAGRLLSPITLFRRCNTKTGKPIGTTIRLSSINMTGRSNSSSAISLSPLTRPLATSRTPAGQRDTERRSQGGILATSNRCLPQDRQPVARGSRTRIRADEPRDA